jgi:hypothetical protein
LLTNDSKILIKKLEREIDNKKMQANWEQLMQFAPIPSGSPEEEQAIQFMRKKIEASGLETKIHRYEAYISNPKYSSLKITHPIEKEIRATPYRQVGSTSPEGFESEIIYVPPEELGYVDCKDKIVLCEQKTSGDWMGLRNGFLLRLEKMGLKGLVVIEQDDYMPTVVHQRADFSVSGSPTSDNIDQIHRIPAILHISNKDGQELKKLVKRARDVRARVVSMMETGWKTLPLLETELKGMVEPEKFILVNAHADTPPNSPGVVDNLSGDVAILELVRLLASEKKKLRRSVRFAIWTGHETGRYAGSTWYNDAMWHDLRHNCFCSYNIDSPGTKGATKFRAVQITEVMDAAQDTIEAVQGHKVDNQRWATRAGDGSFWGTGMPHVSITTSRSPEDYDPHVNYSGGGWWWHTPYATMDHGDINVLELDVKAELNFIIRMVNCPILPFNFTTYSRKMLEILIDMQEGAEKVRDYFNLNPTIDEATKFKELSSMLEEKILEKAQNLSDAQIKYLNKSLMWISRNINPIAHSNAGPSEQMTMETFGALPFPRISEIKDLAKMTPQSHEFKLLNNKLIRQRNIIEEGFYQANLLIEKNLRKLEN